uniref:laccase n=1 Tax=Polyporus grammocephalus TaxID=196234 RepID=C5HL40_9APHY|nr:laccase [Polyporus grammocephalus]
MLQVALSSAFILAALCSSAFGAIGPVADLTLVNDVISPDGFPRAAALAGGQHPGPLIRGNKGDNFRINVIDKLTNKTMLTPTSIHWHGLFQHTTAWADGPAFVTQCPISTGHSFLYNFRATGQAGTFWYHSHLETQYCDGLRGPLVIYDPHDPHKKLYDVDDESTVITLADWHHIAARLGDPIPTQNTTLINGLGRFAGGPSSDLAVINVEKGKRYRFRLINIACDPNYNFTIDGHSMTVIEADGQNTQPHKVDQLNILVAQRYSIVVEANQPVGNYWIRANPNRAEAVGFAGGINSAILRYAGAPPEEPTTNETTPVAVLNEADLRSLTDPRAPGRPVPGGADVNKRFNLDFNGTNFFINNVSYVSPTLPVLLQILSGNLTAQSLLPAGSVYTLPRNQVIEVVVPGGLVGGPHPFHLHGHAFSVVRSAGSKTYNFENPVKRDVVSIGTTTDDQMTLRFKTDNPGPWIFHCHIDFHLQLGLAIVFAEDPQDVKAVNPVPPAWEQLCPLFEESQKEEQ